jgi:transposase
MPWNRVAKSRRNQVARTQRNQGDKIKIVDPDTGVISEAELFVADLGGSNYTYAESLPARKRAPFLRPES